MFAPPASPQGGSGYHVVYTANVSSVSGSNSNMTLTVNGVPDTSTVVRFQQVTNESYTGQAMLTLTAGSVITLRNTGSDFAFVQGSPAVGASISIVQLSGADPSPG